MTAQKQKNQKNVQKRLERIDYLRVLSLAAVGGAVMSCGCYLFCINDLSVKGFQMKELSKKSRELSDEKNKLELDALKLGSLAQVEGKISHLGMVKVEKTEYITHKEKAVAVR